MNRPWRQWTAVLALVLVCLVGHTADATMEKAERLGVLVAAPWQGETAMHHDLVAMDHALRRRGFSPEELLVLEGPLTRSILLTFLQEVHKRIASWRSGTVLFAFSGHGMFSGTTAAEARPGLQLMSEIHRALAQQVSWDEVFAVLNVPAAVQLILLPDS